MFSKNNFLLINILSSKSGMLFGVFQYLLNVIIVLIKNNHIKKLNNKIIINLVHFPYTKYLHHKILVDSYNFFLNSHNHSH